MLEAPLVFMTGGKGLAGLDKARPWGIVLSGTADGQFPVQAFVPVTDLKELMSVVPPMGGKPLAPDAKGVYELPSGPHGKTLYAAQKGTWAFIVDDKDALASVPADPLIVLGELNKKYLFAVQGSIKNIPAQTRDGFLNQLKMMANLSMQQMGNESEEQFALRANMVKQSIDQVVTLAQELDAAVVGLGMDATSGALTLDVELTALPGTKTARKFAAAAGTKTDFAGFQIPGAAATLLTASNMDDADAAQLKTTLAGLRGRALKDIDDNDELNDAQKKMAKQLLGDVVDVVTKTVDGKKLDGGLALLLEPGAPTLVAGMNVADGEKLDKALKQLVEEAGKDEPGLAKLIKLDAEKYAGINFHTASVPVTDEQAAIALGKKVDLVLGIGPQSIYFGAGAKALATIKQVIDASKSDAGKSIPQSQLILAATPIAKFFAAVAPDEKAKSMAGMVAQLLAASGGKDHITIVTRTISNGAGLRLTVEGGILKAILASGFLPGGGPSGPPVGGPGGFPNPSQ
jgi:hypothetical protein